MKKAIFTLAVVLLTITAQAQIKMHSDSHVSIGSLTRNFGLQVQPIGTTYFRTQNYVQYSLATRSKANADHQKHWAVQDCYNNTNEDLFYVLGQGDVWAMHYYTTPSNHHNSKVEAEPINSENALAIILRINGYYYDENTMLTEEEILGNEYVKEEAKAEIVKDLEKKTVALSAENLAEVFPDAVRTDPDNRLGINYNAVITILTEAVKQQQSEIELLRNTLEENGLLEPEEP